MASNRAWHGQWRRGWALVLAAAVQVLVVWGLIRAFTPEWIPQGLVPALTAIDLVPPPATPPPRRATRPAGAAGAAGVRAVAMPVAAPSPHIEIVRAEAPLVASTGIALSSGAHDAGVGTGAGGPGQGTGLGVGGSGAGGGAALVKVAGDITSAQDYPEATRDLRIGDYVIIHIRVGADGRPTACTIARPSRDAEADAITCRLAMARFRFRPATDAAGNPVAGIYGWKQSWHY